MKTILELLMIGILFLIGTIIISSIQLVLWVKDKVVEIVRYIKKS